MRKIRILYIADGRSPTALNWIRYFVDKGMEVHLVSMFPCNVSLGLESIHTIQASFSGAGFSKQAQGELNGNDSIRILKKFINPKIRTWIRHRFVPRGLPQSAEKLSSLIEEIQPDLVHAMRIPFEGMMAALAFTHLSNSQLPLLVSIWGNDFTLHAPATKMMGSLTRQTLESSNGLHAD